MSVFELKQISKSKIDEIVDDFFYRKINLILKNKLKRNNSYHFEIQKSELYIENGRVISKHKVLENIKL